MTTVDIDCNSDTVTELASHALMSTVVFIPELRSQLLSALPSENRDPGAEDTYLPGNIKRKFLIIINKLLKFQVDALTGPWVSPLSVQHPALFL